MTSPVFRPSGSHHWVNCAGSWALEKDKPYEETIHTLTGSAVHALSDWVHNRCEYLTSSMDGKSIGNLVGEPKYKRIYIDPEMIRGVNEYCSFIWGLQQKYKTSVWVEKKVYLNGMPEGIKYGGTVDRLLISEYHIFIVDLKWGTWPVEAEHPQLISYALGALDFTGARHYSDIEISMIIYQPRVNPSVKRVKIRADKLDKVWRPRLNKAIENALKPDPDYSEGPWCKWCHGNKTRTCPLKNRRDITTLNELATVRSEHINAATNKLESTDPVKIAQLLDQVKPIEKAIKTLRSRALLMAQNGVEIPGYRLIDKTGHREWTHPTGVYQMLEDSGYRQDQIMSLNSPAKIEKLVGKQNWISEYTWRPSRGKKLDVDKQITVEASEDFEVIENA
jgi:hypothetical protein